LLLQQLLAKAAQDDYEQNEQNKNSACATPNSADTWSAAYTANNWPAATNATY